MNLLGDLMIAFRGIQAASGEFTIETVTDGSKWYKQTPVDTVQRAPYMDSHGEIKYNKEIVKKLPQIPRRKDKV